MNVEIKEQLCEEIKNQIENLSSMEPGTEEHSKAVETLTKLYRLKIDDDKNEIEDNEKFNRRSMDKEQNIVDAEIKVQQIDTDNDIRKRELELKENQVREEVKSRWINVGLQIGLTVLGIVAYDIWNRRGLRFEETGSITSPQTRNLYSKMLPKWFKN
jgi:hypothetical protein